MAARAGRAESARRRGAKERSAHNAALALDEHRTRWSPGSLHTFNPRQRLPLDVRRGPVILGNRVY